MIAKFYPGESEVTFDLIEPVTITDFQPCVDRVDEETEIVIKEPKGDKIKVITSNMPEDLKKEVVKLIRNYCNL